VRTPFQIVEGVVALIAIAVVHLEFCHTRNWAERFHQQSMHKEARVGAVRAASIYTPVPLGFAEMSGEFVPRRPTGVVVGWRVWRNPDAISVGHLN
jgi:hypothetical protein